MWRARDVGRKLYGQLVWEVVVGEGGNHYWLMQGSGLKEDSPMNISFLGKG